jgi:hypothetical protein
VLGSGPLDEIGHRPARRDRLRLPGVHCYLLVGWDLILCLDGPPVERRNLGGVRKALAALAIAALAATAASGAADSSTHRITGGVRNVTCAGPCSTRRHPPLYTGDGLTVKAERASSERLVAVRRPDDGTFGMRVRHGHYRVSASVAGRCWQGSHKKVRVSDGHVHVRLTVRNVCIL